MKRLQANVDEDLQALNGLQLCVIEMLQGVEKVTNDKLNRTAQVGYDANKKRVYPIAIQILLHCIGKILQSVDVSVDISLIPYLHIDLSNHINDTKSSSGNNSNNSNNAVSLSTPNGKANNTVTSKPPTHIPSGKAKGNKVTNTEVVKSEEVNPNTIDDPVTNNNAMNGKEDTISIDVPMEKRVRQSRGGGGGGQGAGAGVSDKRHDSPPPPPGLTKATPTKAFGTAGTAGTAANSVSLPIAATSNSATLSSSSISSLPIDKSIDKGDRGISNIKKAASTNSGSNSNSKSNSNANGVKKSSDGHAKVAETKIPPNRVTKPDGKAVTSSSQKK